MAPRRKFFVKEGSRFGRLVVLREEKKPSDPHHHYYLCQCDCGNTKLIRDRCLCSGETKSCGCFWKEAVSEYTSKQSEKYAIPLGTRFGYLEVIEDLGTLLIGKKRDHCYKCRCDCGNEVVLRQYCLKRGQFSCGCRRNEKSSKTLSEKAKRLRSYPDWLSSLLVYKEEIEGVKNKEYIYEEQLHFKCSNCGTIVEKPISYVMSLNKNRQDPIVLCLNCSNHRSSFEEEVFQYVYSVIPDLTIKRNIWGVLRDGQVQFELDLYIPERNIAIECNGDYFHSESYNKDCKYHQRKFKLAEDKGIHLIQIFESFWKSNKEKIKTYLKDILSPTYKIYARTCVLKPIDKKEANAFYGMYHLQGGSQFCHINYALYYNEDLIAVMSFSKSGLHEQKNDNFFELVRYAVKSGVRLIGGASKLLTCFEKNHNPVYLLSYSDNDFFTGNMYLKLGFVLEKYTKPRYHWYMRDQTVRTRESSQLKYLSRQYPELYKESLSIEGNKEDFIMTSLRAVKVWHSGNKRWVKSYNNFTEKETVCPIKLISELNSRSLDIKEEVFNFISSLGVSIDCTNSLYDCFIPKHNLAIYFSFTSYHNDLKRPKNYYRDKFYFCSDRNIRSIIIFESDWRESRNKILDLIKYSILPKIKIPARKCEVKHVSIETAFNFYNQYHIQNKSILATINLGLFYNSELVAVMGFGSSSFHNRQVKEGDYELHRFVTKTGFTVVGGASKLLKHFEENYHPKFLLSYSWNDWFSGDMYAKLGFNLTKKIPPDYYWYLDGESINKRKCRLSKLNVLYKDLFQEALDKQASNKEDYVMEKLGAVKIYRSGSKRWEKFY